MYGSGVSDVSLSYRNLEKCLHYARVIEVLWIGYNDTCIDEAYKNPFALLRAGTVPARDHTAARRSRRNPGTPPPAGR